MAAGASVDMASSAAEYLLAKWQPHLVLYHFQQDHFKSLADFKKVLASLTGSTAAVAIIPKTNLELTVELMSLDRCHNVIAEEALDAATLAGVAARHLHGDIFGIEKFIPWGVRVYSMLVGDYQEKSVAIATISEFASVMGVRRKYLDNIERVVDELLMNALYDAPVDDAGESVFAEVSTRDRISIKLEQKAILQYACDGERFAVSVRDHYGTLEKGVILQYLDKCLHAEEQIDRKEGGAGLGLYLVTNSVSQYSVNLHPGVATEAVATFDLKSPKVVLHNFGVFTEKINAIGRLAMSGQVKSIRGRSATASRAAPPLPTTLKVALAGAIILLMVAAGALLWTQLKKPPTGVLTVTSQPPGAGVSIDGTLRGNTTKAGLRLSDLRVDRPHVIRAELKGYKPEEVMIRVSHSKPTLQRFQLEPLKARILVRSKPSGARVLMAGKDTGKLTPAALDLAPKSKVVLTIHMDDYEDVTRTVTTPAPGESAEVPLFKLKPSTDWANVRILSQPPGARIFVNGVMQRGKTPIENLAIPSGRKIAIELRIDGYVPWKTNMSLQPQTQTTIRAPLVRAGYFTLSTTPRCQVRIDGKTIDKLPVKKHPLSVGRHVVALRSRGPYINDTFTVQIKRDQLVDRRIAFATAEVPPRASFRIRIDGRLVRRVGLRAGTRTIVLLDKTSKETKTKHVTLKAGHTTTLNW